MLDKILIEVDKGLKTLTVRTHAKRSRPDINLKDTKDLASYDMKVHSKYMRVNHSGEICAQALYRGQLFFNKNTEIKSELEAAADEELDHLSWCAERIEELGGKKSKLNPILYSSSFLIGAVTSLIDEKYNLGFLAETEKQVSLHLSQHLKHINKVDVKTIKILEQMRSDEEEHEKSAIKMGAKKLPKLAQKLMSSTSKLMTKSTFNI